MEMKKKQNGQGQSKAEKVSVPGEWLYLAPEGVNIRQIAERVKTYEIELWEEAGVLEITLDEGGSMDMEQVKIQPKDELTNTFVAQNGCEEVFLVTFAPEAYDGAKVVMERILSQCGGLFCGDTEDFEPKMRA